MRHGLALDIFVIEEASDSWSAVTVLYPDAGIEVQEENPHVRHWSNREEEC